MRQDWSAAARTSRSCAAHAWIAGLWLIILAGCAPGIAPAPHPAKARPKPGYERRVDELVSVDAAALAGKKIAIDPGHGGVFRGALGVKGLTEAEVNLGVALYLRGLLEARGAQVFLTRTDDRDFLSPADSSLRTDLSERIRLANAFQPDLFVSIHHNADAGGAHDVNEIQTYYKLGDEGPSLDAAQSVHRYLVRNLGIETHRILPGNYYVLRNSVAPGILTESSYITNPDVEAKLVLAAKQRLEAEALFLGLTRFFMRQAPRVLSFAAVAERGDRPDTVFRSGAGPLLSAVIDGPFDQSELEVDGMPADLARRGNLLEWQARSPLVDGRHEATLRVRLAAQGSAPEQRLGFLIARPVHALAIELFPSTLGPRGGLVGARVRLIDAMGTTSLDSSRVSLRALTPGDAPRETVVVARDGIAWGYFRLGSQKSHTIRARWVTAESAHPLEATLRVPVADSKAWAGMALAMPGDTMLAGAIGTSEPDPSVPWLTRDGFAVVTPDSVGRFTPPRLPGFRRWGLDSIPPRYVAVAGGALHGHRIVIDPDGGGDNPAGTGLSGTRSATLNLEVARALAGFLDAAGARVKLTRGGDFALSDVERVQISEAFHAERFLRIAHRAEPSRLGYYFSSAAGKRWAERTAATFATLGLPAPRPAVDAQYPLQQTSCPALYVSPTRVDELESETRLLAPGTIRSEAYGLYLALAREWAEDTSWPIDSLDVRDAQGRPAAGAAVTLGDAIQLETNAQGRVWFARTEPGPLAAEVIHGRENGSSILLDSSRGTAVLTGSRGP